MRKLLVIVVVLLPMKGHAGPENLKRVLTAIPRAVGRTAENMATFKDRNLAFHQWVVFAAVMANAGTEVNLFSRCQNCHELDVLLYGHHPSADRLIGEEFVGAMSLATIQQAAWEASYGLRSAGWRTVERWTPTLIPAAAYTFVAYHNTIIPSDGSRVLSLWQFR